MKTLPLALLVAFTVSPAWAQSEAEKLDLSLPREAATYTADPPGTYYGDKSGPPLATLADESERDPCVVMHNDRDGDGVTGSFTTGVGYSKGYGSSTFNAATINLCKSYNNDDGNTRMFNLNINVGRSDGPGFYGPSFYGPHPGYFGPRR
jgi:hypothetical protein